MKTKPIRVHCAHDKMIALADLKVNPRNYNTHPADQIDMLAKSIARFGWRHPITVSKRSGLIVSGHARLEAARKLGVPAAPVNFQSFRSQAEETAVLIADNRLAELSDPDQSILKDLLLEIDTGDFSMADVGFDEATLEQMMTAAADVPPDKTPPDQVECPKCGFKFNP